MNPPSTVSHRCLLFSAAVSLSLIGACSDRGPTGPAPDSEPPALTVYSNGGAVPEVIITYPDSITETLLFTFTKAPPPQTGQIDGSSFGVDFGHPDGTEYPRGNGYWDFHPEPSYNVVNLPSPGYAASAMYTPPQAFIEFDPPVRSVEFYYASIDGSGFPDYPSNTIPITAYDSNFWPVDQITVSTNCSSWPCGVWDLVQLSSSTDRITWIWIDARLYIDDLEITRALTSNGGVECDEVERGQQTTCRVTDQTASVTSWEFHDEVVGPITHVSTATEWSGKAVLSGLVIAHTSSGVQSGDLIVTDRQGTDLDGVVWDGWLDSMSFQPNTDPQGCTVVWDSVFYQEPIKIGRNGRAYGCEPDYVDPPISTALAAGYEELQVTGGGPNDGLWYVEQAHYRMDRVSQITIYLRPDGPRSALTSKRDKDACEDNGQPTTVNIYEFNEYCLIHDVDEFLAGILRHEGPGTGGQPNGHQARNEMAAASQGQDPYVEAERLVRDSPGDLSDAVFNEILSIDVHIGFVADDHDVVNDNWCGSAFLYEKKGKGRYKEQQIYIEDESGNLVCL